MTGTSYPELSSSKQDVVALSRAAIAKYLSGSGFSCESMTITPDESVAKQALCIVKGWNTGEVNPRMLDAALDAAIGIATLAFAGTTHETQVHIALFTTLVITFDDDACSSEALTAFADRMRTGTPQMHPLLDRFVEVLDDTGKFYPPLAAHEIVRAGLSFVDLSAVECAKAEPPARPGSLSYMCSKRRISGIGRAYANFVWDKASFPDFIGHMEAIPAAEWYIDISNDILSFYKEELDGEKHNFISERAIATNRSTAAALFDTVDEAVDSINNIRSILEGTRELEAFQAAMEGYIQWHRFEKRYKLDEVMGN